MPSNGLSSNIVARIIPQPYVTYIILVWNHILVFNIKYVDLGVSEKTFPDVWAEADVYPPPPGLGGGGG